MCLRGITVGRLSTQSQRQTRIRQGICCGDVIRFDEMWPQVGVLYVGPGQTSEKEVLSNTSGSLRYHSFLDALGEVRCGVM